MLAGSAIEKRTMAKIYLRLLPFCFVLYFICYLDRANISFASLTMNKDLGLTAYIYGALAPFSGATLFSRCRAT